LTLCKHCSAVTEMLVHYQHYSHPKSKTQLYTSYWEENVLYTNQNQNTFH